MNLGRSFRTALSAVMSLILILQFAFAGTFMNAAVAQTVQDGYVRITVRHLDGAPADYFVFSAPEVASSAGFFSLYYANSDPFPTFSNPTCNYSQQSNGLANCQIQLPAGDYIAKIDSAFGIGEHSAVFTVTDGEINDVTITVDYGYAEVSALHQNGVKAEYSTFSAPEVGSSIGLFSLYYGSGEPFPRFSNPTCNYTEQFNSRASCHIPLPPGSYIAKVAGINGIGEQSASFSISDNEVSDVRIFLDYGYSEVTVFNADDTVADYSSFSAPEVSGSAGLFSLYYNDGSPFPRFSQPSCNYSQQFNTNANCRIPLASGSYVAKITRVTDGEIIECSFQVADNVITPVKIVMDDGSCLVPSPGDKLPTGTIVTSLSPPPEPFYNFIFTDPGPQTHTFADPSGPVTGIWASVTTNVTGAILYFDIGGVTYSKTIAANSNTLLVFNEAKSVSNVRITIEDREFADDATNVAYIHGALQINNAAYIPAGYKGASQPAYSVSDLKLKAQEVTSYYLIQSSQSELLVSDFVPESWMQLPNTKDYYDINGNHVIDGSERLAVRDAVISEAASIAGLETSEYSAILVLVDDDSVRSFMSIFDSTNKGLSGAGLDYAVWAHELGHGIFHMSDYYIDPDSYTLGDLGYWDLMGTGHILDYHSPITSYLRQKLGWANYQTISTGQFGTYAVPRLDTVAYGSDALRYEVNQRCVSSYVFETREGEAGRPHVELPEGVEVYEIQPDIFAFPTFEKVYFVPQGLPAQQDQLHVTLPPGSSLTDKAAGVKFTAVSSGPEMKIEIEPIQNSGTNVVAFCDRISFSSTLRSGSALVNNIDLDLHAYSQDRHVGQDYLQGIYEIGIPGSESSGNIPGGGPEWISLPDTTSAYFQVEPYGMSEFLDDLGLSPDAVRISAFLQIIHYDDSGIPTTSSLLEIPVSAEEQTLLAVPAAVDIHPKAINLKSSGNFLTSYIELGNVFSVGDIDTSSVAIVQIGDRMLTTPILAEQRPITTGDRDADGIPDLMMKFRLEKVKNSIYQAGINLDNPVSITIEGIMKDHLPFSGKDLVKVIQK